ncbi:sulfopropanediol 3-dehydrogenase [Arthrobacter sp. 1088]|uniref:histidinol dehydrogenase n=1 Tax=Arthrobacter sp. 1088 TaxID=2817768 RepID=UPI00286211BA|nr:histidinol dehydrogenase [Arthrobacter sp. 1088]MDR6687729.1 sulfopropanediol 3-dehydrogenase [Arthrobacter sp. 1088]
MVKYLKQAPSKSFADNSHADVAARVGQIISEIRADGDAAVRKYAELFDKQTVQSFRLTDTQIEEIMGTLDQQVIDDIVFVQEQVRTFAQAQRESMQDIEIQTLPGVFLGHRHVPVQAAGAYIPGGKYPLTASAHMTIITAKVAGVPRVVACTPPIRGEIPAATIAAMKLAGADEIYLLGGVQAVASMALGTESMPRVDMIAGPGNAYVAEAKRQLFGEIGIDLFAGPTEVLIIADADADPFTIAVDLLSQAEHGPDSPAILVSTSESVALAVLDHIERILPDMPTKDFAEPAWRNWGQVVVVENIDEAYEVADGFAAEHVQVFTADPTVALDKMHNYGALFLGENTCVSFGDKVIGTNHVLPTLGAARYTGGLWVGKYLKTVTYQVIENTDSSAELGRVLGRAARVELFEGHARSGDVRAWRHAGEQFDWIDRALAGSTPAGVDR